MAHNLEHELQQQQSAAEVKKDEYLKSVELLKKLIQENGTKSDVFFCMFMFFL